MYILLENKISKFASQTQRKSHVVIVLSDDKKQLGTYFLTVTN